MCTGAEVALLMAGASTAITVKQQRDVAGFQQEQATALAEEQKAAGEIRADKVRERAKRVAASARAAMAASGLDITSITGGLIEKDIFKRGEEGAFTEELQAEDRATALRQQADVFSLRKSQAAMAGAADFGQSAISIGGKSGWYGSAA
jgi:hypothetical protein